MSRNRQNNLTTGKHHQWFARRCK